MTEHVARYGNSNVPVTDFHDGVPFVFIGGKSQPAADVTIHGSPFEDIYLAPAVVPAHQGTLADFDYIDPEAGSVTVQSLPVVAWIVQRTSGLAEGLVATQSTDGAASVSDREGPNVTFVGYRVVGIAP